MKTLFRKTLLVSLFLQLACGSQDLYAGHIAGAELTWRCVGKDSFIIQLVVYRDCNSQLLGPSQIIFTCASTGNTVASMLTIGAGTGVDITPICKSSCTRCSNAGCSFPYGIEKYTMQGLVDLSSAGSCCNINIASDQCCRSAAITTLASGSDLWIEASLNRCVSPCDNSPRFNNSPLIILCQQQAITFDNNVTDNDTDSHGKLLDSLSYQWTPPLQGYNNPVVWSGSYTYDKPITFWGFPNSALPYPRGYHLDPNTGKIGFQPNAIENTVIAILVNEYRKGVLIGQVSRDVMLTVMACPTNHPPTITTPNNITYKEVCAGNPVSFDFSTNDQDLSDTVTISWDNSIKGAMWISTNGTNKHPTSNLTWTPTDNDVSSIPYSFNVTAKDNACPFSGVFLKSYQILVKPNPKANIMVADSGCNLVYMKATPIAGSSPTYLWNGGNGTDSFSIAGSIVKRRLLVGNYHLSMTITSLGCAITYLDSIKADTLIIMRLPHYVNICSCGNRKVFISTTTLYTKGKVSYVWGIGHTISKDTGQTISLIVNHDTTIYCQATDASGCNISDSTKIKILKGPEVDLGTNRYMCPGSSLTLIPTVNFNGSRQSIIVWSDLKTGKILGTDSILIIYNAGIYGCTVTDTSGCIGKDSVQVYENPKLDAIATGKIICAGDTAQLYADSTGGGNTNYSWYEINKTGTDSFLNGERKIYVQPLVTTDYWLKLAETTAGVTCRDSLKLTVLVNKLPVIQIFSLSNTCINNLPFDLDGYVTVNGGFKFGGVWRSLDTGTIGSNYFPSVAGLGYHWLIYAYSDPSTNCSNEDSVRILVNPKPDIDFIAAPLSGNVPLSVVFTNLSSIKSGSINIYYWDFGDSDTSININPMHIYHTPNLFSVSLTGTSDNGCKDVQKKDNYIDCGTSVIENYRFSEDINIYPNPTNGTLNIEIKHSGKDILLTLTDLFGKQVRTVRIPANQSDINQTLDISELAKGVYFLNIARDDGKRVVKITKN